MATFCAGHNAVDHLRTCTASLARIATATGQAEALAALAHALGQTALTDGDPEGAASQFERAVTLLQDRPLPFERAQSLRSGGIALLQAGDRDAGVQCLVSAYHTARQLGARPLAMQISGDLSARGERVERRLGRRAAGALQRAGLSRRELEVLQLIAAGRTNREIAHELFLSTRTVDMHARNILAKLDCRSRTDATRRATELGLLG
jgi:ATP/maltotriose-dependent transcriptional regulator MalT